MKFIEQNQNIILVLLVMSLIAFFLLVLSPFIPISPIQYLTKTEKAMIYNNAGVNDMARKDFAKAENNFRKAALFDAGNVIHQESLGVALLSQPEKKNQAVETFNKILTKDSDNLTALYYLGSIAQGDSDYEEAKKKFQAYLNINPQNPEVLTLLGVVYYKTGNKEGAKEQWQKALAVDPNFEAAKGNLMATEQEMAQGENKE